jgi:hypothetical protein
MASEEDRREMKALLEEGRTVAGDMKAVAAFIRSYPGLAWIKRYDAKNSTYVMVELSDQYVLRILGGHRDAYIGKTDFDVWTYEEAEVFRQGDDDTRTGRRNPTQKVIEPWESSRTGQKGTFEGRKWAFSIEGDTYVAGIE